ncbi:hypothetical protein DFQ28_004352 [Apophysomyces sp. BC1034]|nr:hypothetical protein DFQ30_006227 [Apophysomyces sp. BC1015]KAG0178406.1 hypothetical protein DFQ29_003498 [Apophysomyces sp. BC1021]KAG0188794.1 hypothetical protein DFQ28_004352 [Apophysomyces sp. BC1034]
MTDISFEHFDPELELGNLDENGRPIRPRKKPGRKPNPPSPAQRKAQNRAAQRAFRERKRREMREAETTVKRCLQIRDRALREANSLRKKTEELRYENNYLKGCVLTLKLACVANRVDVPKFWDTGATDDVGAERLTYSRTQGIPQSLEFFLDKYRNIISIDQNHVSPPKEVNTFDCSPPSALVDLAEELSLSPGSSGSSSDSFLSLHSDPLTPSFADQFQQDLSPMDISQSLATIAPQLATHLESSFFQQLLNTDLMSNLDNINLSEQLPTELVALVPPEWRSLLQTLGGPKPTKEQEPDIMEDHSSSTVFIKQEEDGETEKEEEEEEEWDAKTGLLRSTTEFNPDHHEELPSTDKKILPPMSPLQALDYLRAMKNMDKDTRALHTPTELQRTIPHDTRIDVVPGAAMRDHMIVFQDFYDANELFNYLLESATFLGGELGNPDCWFVSPNFLSKYWFLCPNHKPQRMDNVVDIMVQLGQRMIQMMFERKQMYIQRERYAEYFPLPENETQSVLSGTDIPLDVVMDLMETMPRAATFPA